MNYLRTRTKLFVEIHLIPPPAMILQLIANVHIKEFERNIFYVYKKIYNKKRSKVY